MSRGRGGGDSDRAATTTTPTTTPTMAPPAADPRPRRREGDDPSRSPLSSGVGGLGGVESGSGEGARKQRARGAGGGARRSRPDLSHRVEDPTRGPPTRRGASSSVR